MSICFVFTFEKNFKKIKTIAMRCLLLHVFCVLALGLSAQHDHHHLQPCGSAEHIDGWYRRYVAAPQQYETRGQNVLFIPLSIHTVGQSDTSGFVRMDKILEAFCQLNADYQDANIQFYMAGPPRYIANTAFNNHLDIVDGANFMFQYNIPNTMNSYVVANAAGNCGYNMRYAGNIIATSCLDGHTWAHENGHYFNCQHPFIGWEGKTYNYNDPTPDSVTYDYTNFRDTLWGNDTTIIDTALVELVDRSNCATAADLLCDTEADYLAYRWFCNPQGLSNQLQRDPNDVDFRSDASLIMSYADDGCQSRFSNDQIALMRAYIVDERANLLTNNNPFRDPITQSVTQLYPIGGQFVVDTPITFRWSSVANATHYNFQVGIQAGLSLIYEDVVVTDTFYTAQHNFNPLPPGTSVRYAWRVKPFNTGYSCAPMSPSALFGVEPYVASIQEVPGLGELRLYPQPVVAGEALSLNLNAIRSETVMFQLVSMSGQTVRSWTEQVTGGQNQFWVPTAGLSAGLYALRVGNAVVKVLLW